MILKGGNPESTPLLTQEEAALGLGGDERDIQKDDAGVEPEINLRGHKRGREG